VDYTITKRRKSEYGDRMVNSEANVKEPTHSMPQPHGGRLVNRVLANDQSEAILDQIDELPEIVVDNDTLADIRNIAEGVFSPLEGFMEHGDFMEVIRRGRLVDGTPWTIPIVLDVSKQKYHAHFNEGDEVILRSELGQLTALLTITDIFNFDKRETARLVFGTDDSSHPGVAKTLSMGDKLIGGKIDLISRPENRFEEYRLSPIETREAFNRNKWKTVAGFQTRNVPHLGHEYLQKTALTFVDGLFINPIIGKKKRGDFKDEVILAAYETLIANYFSKTSVVLGVLQTEMRYAGPKEAIFHAIIRKNFGCTHFIVGRDHAGVDDFYLPFAAHDIFNEYPDLGITPLFFPSIFFCNRCKSITNDKACPHSQICRQDFSGTKLRESINKGEKNNLNGTPTIRPEVSAILSKWKNPII
jgi:sulfate adenylyltransferase